MQTKHTANQTQQHHKQWVNKKNHNTRYARPNHRSFSQWKPTTKNKTKNKDNNQPTLTEIWKISMENNNTKQKLQRRKLHGNSTNTTFKRVHSKRNNQCMICKEGWKLIECHTCTNTYHIICDDTMPTNVRHQAVVWRCQDYASTEGNTNCRVAKWADGHRQEHDETLKDIWNTQHSWVGKLVTKMFDNVPGITLGTQAS
jgi:hypothetical protein